MDTRRDRRNSLDPLSTLPPSGEPERTKRPPAAAGRFAPGTVLAARYRIVSILGRGGMGEVYRADDLKLGVPVALKLLPQATDQLGAKLSQLFEEVKVARQVAHPNVCRVYDVGEADGLHFISMEFIDGEDLASLRRRIGRLPMERAVEIGLELCGGLEAIHREGILHRDLKPSNLMVDGEGQARITDFGLARLVESISGPDARCGTPAYMAPEQLAGREVSVASDLYALGLVLYELATGQRAFEVKSAADLDRLQRDEAPEPPSRRLEGFDPAVERVILHCLEEDPAARPASAAEVAEALGRSAVLGWRPAPGLAVPHRLHWTLERKLDEGGFGDVWLASHAKTRERRAFKFSYESLKLGTLQREITLFRLLKEELGDRDDIVRIFDWNFDEAPYFIESEYTEGGDLTDWAREQGGLEAVPLPLRLEIVAQVATALSAAHSVGVLHQDVKPGNVLMTRYREGSTPRAKLTDFGVGALTESERLADAGITPLGLTEPASVGAGTRLYLAPELLEGKASTIKADVYALGVLLYQMAVADFSHALAQGWQRDVEDDLLRDDIAAAVDGSPQRRLGDARQLAQRVRSLEARHAEREAERRLRRALERSRRRRTWVAGVIGALVVFAAVLGFQVRRAALEASRSRDIARVAVAGEWMGKDPTKAALVLADVEAPDETPTAVAKMRSVLSRGLATLELAGHRHIVWTAAFSPDGERVVTASQDGTARVWNAAGAGDPVVLSGHTEALVSASFSPDGQRIVTASQDGTARVWNVDGTGGAIVLDGHEGPLRTAAFDAGGGRVVTASEDGTARVWDLAAAADPRALGGHEYGCFSAAFTAAGRVVTVSYDGTVRIWADGEVLQVLAGRDGLARAVSFGRGRVVTVSHGGTARVWTTGESPGEALVLESSVLSASFSPDGERLVTASGDGQVRLYPRGRVLGRLDGPVVDVSFGPRGERVLTISGDSTVRVWGLGGAGDSQVLEGHGGPVFAASFSPDGERVATASGDRTARLWDLGGSGEPIVLGGHEGPVVAASFSPDGERVVMLSGDGTVRMWDPATRATLATRAGGELIRAASFSPDGRRIVTVSRLYSVRVHLADGSGPPVVLEAREGWAASFSPDGGRVVVASVDGTAQLWDLEGGEPRVLEGHDGPVFAASFSPDGERVVTASGDRTARVWRAVVPGDPPLVLSHDSAVLAASFSPDGERVVTASGDGTARVWDTGGEGPVVARLLEGHGNGLWAASFSPDGRRLVTASEDGTARVWSVDGGGEPLVLEHDGAVLAASFSPDGRRVVTASGDGTARLWRIETAEILARLRSATKICLPPAFRETNLGESTREARRRFEACERSHGRG